MRIGLKLWSTNRHFTESAVWREVKAGFDYLELFSVPGSFNRFIGLWKEQNKGYIIHAPHYSFQFNLSLKSSEEHNRKLYGEAQRFADALDAPYIVTHGGVNGKADEVVRQILLLNEPRMVLENKPVFGLDNTRCIGGTVEEMSLILRETGLPFCLDVAHAIHSAAILKTDPYDYISRFEKLGPVMYHLSDGDIGDARDSHLNFGKGNYDFPKILRLLKSGKYLAIETGNGSPGDLEGYRNDRRFLKEALR